MYKLMVLLPKGYETGADKYPVLYIISGKTFGPYFADMTRVLAAGDIPKLIVARIHFTDGGSYSLDLPTTGNDPQRKISNNRVAATFLEIGGREIKPFVDQHYRIRAVPPLSSYLAGQTLRLHHTQVFLLILKIPTIDMQVTSYEV